VVIDEWPSRAWILLPVSALLDQQRHAGVAQVVESQVLVES
jgi:hypothetical protein